VTRRAGLDRTPLGEARARLVGIALHLPTPAFAEVRAVRADTALLLADLLSRPPVVLGDSIAPPPPRSTSCLRLPAVGFRWCSWRGSFSGPGPGGPGRRVYRGAPAALE